MSTNCTAGYRRATEAEQRTVWLTVRIHTSDGSSDPLTVRELADLTRLHPTTVRDAIRTLSRGGLLHIERRRDTAGGTAPSRYRCTTPRRPHRSHDLERLMRQTPRGH